MDLPFVLIICTAILSIIIICSTYRCLSTIEDSIAVRNKEAERHIACKQNVLYTLEMSVDRIYNVLLARRALSREYFDLTCYTKGSSSLVRDEENLIKKALKEASASGKTLSVDAVMKLADKLFALADKELATYKEAILKDHHETRLTDLEVKYRRATPGLRRYKFEEKGL